MAPNIVAVLAYLMTLLLAFTPFSYGAYEYFIFVQQWSSTVCGSSKCKDPFPVFTIHGLWPANHSGVQVIDCPGAQFDPAEMNMQTVLKKNLETKSWPDVKNKTPLTFWKKEWNKHGRCSLSVFTQTPYFQRSHDMWTKMVVGDMLKKASIVPVAGAKYKLPDIEQAIKHVTLHDPLIRCIGVQLFEIGICYDHLGTNVIDCHKKESNCKAGDIEYPEPKKRQRAQYMLVTLFLSVLACYLVAWALNNQ